MRDENERVFDGWDSHDNFVDEAPYYHSDPGHIFESDASDYAYRVLSLKEISSGDIDKRLQSILKSYAMLQRADFLSNFHEWEKELQQEEQSN